jgi:DNA (cytosine-5)-methyltransferase 1
MSASPAVKVASFFSGIGGFDLGFERAGCEVIFQCEIDPFCRKLLNQHWPKVPQVTDIKEINEKEIPKAKVWCAGFPCQDVSLARARPREGLKGKRSGLFYEFAKLLKNSTPEIVIIENVPGLLNSHGGKDFAIIIHTMVECGYGVAWRVLNSRFFGVPQSRRRVYIVGYRGDPRRAFEILFEPECGERNTKESKKSKTKALSPFRESAGKASPNRIFPYLNGNTPLVPKLAFCLAATSGRHTGTDWSRTYVAYKERARRLTPSECEGLQGFPPGWTTPTGTIMNDDIESQRYSALGNAVTVNVAEWLGKRIKASLNKQNKPSTRKAKHV